MTVKRKSALLVILSAIMLAIAGIHFATLDGFIGTMFCLVTHDDTKYSTQYSDPAFRKITPGMTTNELITAIGYPLVIWSRDTEFVTHDPISGFEPRPDITYIWRYTVSPNDSNYRIRSVTVINGRVTGKHAEYYLD